jgi:hypothetical protein
MDTEEIRAIRQARLDRKIEKWQAMIKRREEWIAVIEKSLVPYDDYAFITQPILVGHHSERSHRNLKDRINRKMDRQHELYNEIEELKRKIENASNGARVKGDTERERDLKRADNDLLITVGSSIYDPVFREGVVIRVNKKTYTIKFNTGFVTPRDKSYIKIAPA